MPHSQSNISRSTASSIPMRVRIHPGLLDVLLPLPADPLTLEVDPVERRRLVRTWREDIRTINHRRTTLLRRLGSTALSHAFQRADRSGLDIAHLPFIYEGPEGTVSCTLSAGVSTTGLLVVDVCAWDRNAPSIAFAGRDMAAQLVRNRDKAKAMARFERTRH